MHVMEEFLLGIISIGNNVGVAYRCQLLTTNHDYSDGNKRTGKVSGADIVIEDGCWIGAGVIILSGVTIKNGGWLRLEVS